MKKKVIVALLIIGLSLCACGGDGAEYEEAGNAEVESQEAVKEKEETESTEGEEAEPKMEWKYAPVELPDADAAMEELVPEDCEVWRAVWGMAYENVYRVSDIVKPSGDGMDDEVVATCIQILMPPYTEWNNYTVTPGEWTKEDYCSPWERWDVRCISEEGAVYLMLHGTDGEYLGRWSKSMGPSVTKLENDWMTEELFKEVWVGKWDVSDENGVFLSFSDLEHINYHSFWMDEVCEKEKEFPDLNGGYIWQVCQNLYSEKTYLFGVDEGGIKFEPGMTTFENKGFTIWDAEEKEPVFISQETGMTYDDFAFFTSETEGYLSNLMGIWKFSLDDQSLEYLLSMSGGGISKRATHGMCEGPEGAVLVLTENILSEYGDRAYYLWKLWQQEVQAEE